MWSGDWGSYLISDIGFDPLGVNTSLPDRKQLESGDNSNSGDTQKLEA